MAVSAFTTYRPLRLLPALLIALLAAQCALGSKRISESEFRAGEYNGRIAYALAELSEIAYEINYAREKELRADLKKRVSAYIEIDRSAVFHDDDSDSAGFIVANDDVVVVTFRGTKTVANMLTDLNAQKQPFSFGEVGGQVHAGFMSAGESVFAMIKNKIGALQDSEQPILFTGHSLGAALATIAVARRLVPPGQVFGLYTFGSPRVGDATFARSFDRSFNNRTYRFSNYRDPVTGVPPEMIGFQHVGRLVYFDDEGVLQHAPSNPYQCGLFSMASCVNDHGIRLYRERVAKNIDRNPFAPPAKSCWWPF